MLHGLGTFWTASTLMCVVWSPTASTRCPKYFTKGLKKEHFECLARYTALSITTTRFRLATYSLSLCMPSNQQIVKIVDHARKTLQDHVHGLLKYNLGVAFDLWCTVALKVFFCPIYIALPQTPPGILLIRLPPPHQQTCL